MDIYDIINMYGENADYFDLQTGYTFHIEGYFRNKRLGLPDIYGGILVTDYNGNIVGVCEI